MKTRYLFLYLFLLPLSLFASDWSMEVGGAFYRPRKSLKETYSGGWTDYQLETSYHLDCHTDAFVGINWISKRHITDDAFVLESSSGDLKDYDDKKKIWILPISLGAKYFYYMTSRLSVYLGAGAVCTFVKAEHHSVLYNDHFSKIGLGAVIKSGIRYDWGNYTFVNLFVDYFHQNFNLSHSQRFATTGTKTLDLSAAKVGLTIGVYF